MNKDVNILNWFETPVTDMARAKKFYQTVFDIAEMPEMEFAGNIMAMFPGDNGNGKLSGALVQGEGYTPTMEGSLLYLNADPAMAAIDKVEAAGGKVIMPKTSIGEFGNMAIFIDTEGNRMAMHSNA